MERIKQFLIDNQDNRYGDFIYKLTPTIPRETIIGVRSPVLRKFIRTVEETEKESFLKELPHHHYEENMLHGFIISELKDYKKAIYELDRFLPYVNNWATSDTMCPKIFSKHKDEVYQEVKRWIKAKDTYSVRFAIDVLMTHFLDKDFSIDHFALINSVHSDEYYIKMMQAWYYATALVKQYESAIKVIESKQLSKWVHNKSIQKAIESFRITPEQKEYLKTLKI